MRATLDELMADFDFTADDLAANQRGAFSERQRARLQGGRWGPLMTTGCLFVGNVGACTLVPGVPAWRLWLAWGQDGGTTSLVGAALLSVLALVGAGVGVWVVLQERGGRQRMSAANATDLAAGVVAQADAVVWVDPADQHLYAVNEAEGVQVFVDETGLLDEGDAVRVYFTPTGNLLLSIEPQEI